MITGPKSLSEATISDKNVSMCCVVYIYQKVTFIDLNILSKNDIG